MLAAASSVGSSAAPAATRSARDCAMRERAAATVGLAACAESISCASSGSPWRCHQLASSVRLPLCAGDAYHCGGTCASTFGAGGDSAQAHSASGAAAVIRNRTVFMLFSFVAVIF